MILWMFKYVFGVIEWTIALYLVILLFHKRILGNGWTLWSKPVEQYDLWSNKRMLIVCGCISLVPVLRAVLLITWVYCAFVEKKG